MVDSTKGYTEEMVQFLEAAKPLMKWLSDNRHPMYAAGVTSTGAVLVEHEMQVGTEEFIKD